LAKAHDQKSSTCDISVYCYGPAQVIQPLVINKWILEPKRSKKKKNFAVMHRDGMGQGEGDPGGKRVWSREGRTSRGRAKVASAQTHLEREGQRSLFSKNRSPEPRGPTVAFLRRRPPSTKKLKNQGRGEGREQSFNKKRVEKGR